MTVIKAKRRQFGAGRKLDKHHTLGRQRKVLRRKLGRRRGPQGSRAGREGAREGKLGQG